MREIKVCLDYAAQLSNVVIVEKAINLSMFIFKPLPIRTNRAGGSQNRIACKKIGRPFLAEQTHLAALGLL